MESTEGQKEKQLLPYLLKKTPPEVNLTDRRSLLKLLTHSKGEPRS